MIVLRMRAGKRLKAQRGGYTGGWLPLGYTATDGDFAPDPAEQRTLDRIKTCVPKARAYARSPAP
jgi:hypothetical protein